MNHKTTSTTAHCYFNDIKGDFNERLNKLTEQEQLSLIDQILIQNDEAYRHDENRARKGWEKLAEIFGLTVEEIRADPRFGSKRLMYTLTGKEFPYGGGFQFRAWYAPFGSVSKGHFDSCGTGVYFQISCDDELKLYNMVRQFTDGLCKWELSCPHEQNRGNILWVGRPPW